MDTINGVRAQQSSAFSLRAIVSRFLAIVLTPFFGAAQVATHYAKRSASPMLHVALLSILIPFLGISSLGAGVIINRWIPTGWTQPIYLQYGDVGRAPHAEASFPELSSSQPYDISLQLVLPHFAKNAELGNFMSSITIKTPTNITIGSSTRPSLIFPPSIYISPFILGGLTSTRTHEVELLKDFYASSYASSLTAYITVGRNDVWKGIGVGQGREVVVVDAFIKGVPRPRGIRSFLARHPYILLVITTSTFFITSTMATIAIYIYLSPRIHIGEGEDIVKREEQPYGPLAEIKAEEDEDEDEEGLGGSELVIPESAQSRTTEGNSIEEDEDSGASDLSVVDR